MARLEPGGHRRPNEGGGVGYPREGVERGAHRVARRRGAEHAVLHVDHLDRRGVVTGVGGAASVLEQEALVPAVVGLAHGGVDADVGGDAPEDDAFDPARAQDEVQVRRAEGSLPRLVHDVLGAQRVELGDDVPAGLAPYEDPAARPGVADARARLPRPPPLVVGEVRQGRAVALARVYHPDPRGASGGEDRAERLDGCSGQRHVVAHLRDVSAEAAEVGLHVDEYERDVVGGEGAVVGPRVRLGGSDARHPLGTMDQSFRARWKDRRFVRGGRRGGPAHLAFLSAAIFLDVAERLKCQEMSLDAAAKARNLAAPVWTSLS